MLLEVNPYAPSYHEIKQIVEVLKKGGIIVYPSDSVYSYGCSLNNKKALERLAKLKGEKLHRAKISIICSDIQEIAEYVLPMNKTAYKIVKRALPGAYTFIFPAKKEVTKLFDGKKHDIGVRIPDHLIPVEIVKALGCPLATVSLRSEDEILEYETDPMAIAEKLEDEVDLIIDGGYGNLNPSTVVDFTGNDVQILREGSGEIFF